MKTVTVVVLLLSWVLPADGQVRTVGIRADSSALRTIDGRQVVEMFRAVLTQETVTLRAQRAIDYGTGEYHFFRNVRIVEEGDTLTAAEVRYNRFTRVGRATGQVRLGDGEVVVTAPEGDFDLRSHRADFRAGVRMVDSASVLTSLQGSYWTEEKRAEFAGSVRLDSDDSDVAADSLTYHRVGRRSDARGNVVVRRYGDSQEETWILSDRTLNDDSLGTGLAMGDVLIARIGAPDSLGARPDSLFIRADRVHSARADQEDRTSAAGSVVVWDPGFSALADSVSQQSGGLENRSESRLFGSPMIWVDESQVWGDSIRVSGTGGGIDSLLVSGISFVARMDTTLGKLQQMTGQGLVGLFKADSLRSLAVYPNARAVFFNKDDAGQLSGAVQVSADLIRFTLKNGEVDSMGVHEGVDGTLLPVELIPDNLKLDGLLWLPENRPDARALRGRLEAAIRRFADQDLQD